MLISGLSGGAIMGTFVHTIFQSGFPMILNTPDTLYASVMLVDDSDIDNFINEKIIRASRFATDIHSVTSFSDALLYLTKKSAEGNLPEVVFIDLNMPVMSGYQLLAHLMRDESLRDIKVVVLTSSLHEKDREQALAIAQEVTYLTKPLRPEMLFGI
jgi:CheY-like chemotaxis protein